MLLLPCLNPCLNPCRIPCLPAPQSTQAFTLPRPEDASQAYFPHILIKNTEVEIDFCGTPVFGGGTSAEGPAWLDGHRPWQEVGPVWVRARPPPLPPPPLGAEGQLLAGGRAGP